MAERESHSKQKNEPSRGRGTAANEEACEPCKTFGQKCSHIVKKQRARFYILRRCIAMLVCWRDRSES